MKTIFYNKNYSLYFIGTTISIMATGMQFIANTWIALNMTNNSFSIALVLFFSTLPSIIFSLGTGTIVDKFNVKHISIIMDLFRASLLITIFILWYLNLLQIWHIYMLSFFMSIGDNFYNPSVFVLIRKIITSDLLLEANSKVGVGNQIGLLLGSAIGGIIMSLDSPILVMLVNGFLFIISAIITSRIEIKINICNKVREKSFIKDIKLGYMYICKHITIVYSYFIVLFLFLTIKIINMLLPIFCKNLLGVGSIEFGYIDASFAAGAIIGGLLLSFICKKYNRKIIMFIGIMLLSISIMMFSFSVNLIYAMCCYFCIGFSIQVRILYLTLIQEKTNIKYQGRVHSIFNMVFSLISIVLYFSMGYFGEFLSVDWLYKIYSIILICISFFSYKKFYKERRIDKCKNI